MNLAKVALSHRVSGKLYKMTEIRSILVRFGRLFGIGGAGSYTDLLDISLREEAAESDRKDLEKPDRRLAWLALEILLVTILVFFWL